MDALQIVFMIAFPAAIAELCKRNKIAGMVGPVVICYAVGFLLGNNHLFEINKEISKTSTKRLFSLPFHCCCFLQNL